MSEITAHEPSLDELGGEVSDETSELMTVDDAPSPWDVMGEPEPVSDLAPPVDSSPMEEPLAPPVPPVDPNADPDPNVMGVPPEVGDELDSISPTEEIELPETEANVATEPPADPTAAPGIELTSAVELASELEASQEALAELATLGIDPDGDGVQHIAPETLAVWLEGKGLAGTEIPSTVPSLVNAVTEGQQVVLTDGGGHPLVAETADQATFTLANPETGERFAVPSIDIARGLEDAGNQVLRVPSVDVGKVGAGPDVPVAAPDSTPPAALGDLPSIEDEVGADRGIDLVGTASAALVVPLVVGAGYLASRKLGR
jgi:hypothetical protein